MGRFRDLLKDAGMEPKGTGGLAELKRRIKVGTTLLCVKNSKRPEFDGQMRTVVKSQGNGFYWSQDGDDTRPKDDRRFWTEYPKAALMKWIDADTFQLSLDETGTLYVQMRIVG